MHSIVVENPSPLGERHHLAWGEVGVLVDQVYVGLLVGAVDPVDVVLIVPSAFAQRLGILANVRHREGAAGPEECWGARTADQLVGERRSVALGHRDSGVGEGARTAVIVRMLE